MDLRRRDPLRLFVTGPHRSDGVAHECLQPSEVVCRQLGEDKLHGVVPQEEVA